MFQAVGVIPTAPTTDRWVAAVIASVAKQSSGLALSILLVALDYFATLAMTASVVARGHWFGRVVFRWFTGTWPISVCPET